MLVNNAAVFRILGMPATSLDEYMRIVTINQVGTFLGMKAVTQTMVGQGSGSIVNISSVAGLTGSTGTIAYTASIEARANVSNGRLATAEDVARMVLYLASEDSAYSTGSEFIVDGGMTARL